MKRQALGLFLSSRSMNELGHVTPDPARTRAAYRRDESDRRTRADRPLPEPVREPQHPIYLATRHGCVVDHGTSV